MDTKEKKKKRGRKPKNIINSKGDIDINKNNIDKNLIVHIKLNGNDELDQLPGYSFNKCNELNEFNEYTSLNTKYNCWNCCHSINNLFSIPLKYDKEKFYTYGDFCSLNCALRYIIDNYRNKELWEKYELFHFYYNKIYGENIDIKIPPNRLCLDFFGGNLTIDEYRNEKYYCEINNPIVIPIKNNLIKKNKDNIISNKGDLKLYRKKKRDDKTIINNMNFE